MKKRNMLFAGIVSAIVIMSSVSLHAMAEENVVFTYDFDNLADMIVDGTEDNSTVDDLNALDSDVLTFVRKGTSTQIKIGAASGTKVTDSSLTVDGESDKDVYLTNDLTTKTSTGSVKLLLPILHTAEKDIKVSFNLYGKIGKDAGRDGIIYVELAGDGKSYKIIEAKSAKGSKLTTSSAGIINTTNVNNKYCRYELILHTASNKVDISRKYMEGETIVEEILASGVNISSSFDVTALETIKFGTYYGGKASTETKKDVACVDDITVSEIDQAPAITEFSVSAPEICVGDAAVAEITAGTAAVGKVHVQVPANLTEAKNITLIGALYDGNELVQAYTDGTKTYPAGGAMLEEDITLNMPLTEAEAGYTVKLFVWDTAVNMLPISQIVPTATIVE